MGLTGLMKVKAKDYAFMNKVKADDGYGGYKDRYEEGIPFEAAVVSPQNLQTEIAKKDGVTSIYQVTTDKSIFLDFHDVFKDVETGQVYRVTTKSNDETPDTAGIDVRICRAEEWELPSE